MEIIMGRFPGYCPVNSSSGKEWHKPRGPDRIGGDNSGFLSG
jgi:hypothetical protein